MSFAPPLPPLWLVLLGAAALVATLASARMSRRLSTNVRFGTAVLRFVVLALVLLVLANPVQRGETSLPAPGVWQAVLLDTSASMGLGGEHPRWREGLEWTAPILNGNAEGMTTRLVTFDNAVNLAPGTPAEARGTASHLGQAIERVLEQAGETPPTQLVVVSDGIFDDAEPIAAAIAKARARRTVISTHVVGRDEVLPNLAFKRFCAPRFADPNSRVVTTCEIAASGLPPATPLNVTIRGEDGAIAAQDSWTVRENTKPREIQLAVGERPGRFTAQLDVARGEVTETDNALSFHIDITDPKIRVFYGEGSHTQHDIGTEKWSALRFIPTAFRRAGDIDCDLFTTVVKDARNQPPYYLRGLDENQEPVLDMSRTIPQDAWDWWRYDVIIISDIDRHIFSKEQMEWVQQAVVDRGCGFAMFGGYEGFDAGYYDQTLWEKLIPVDCHEFGFGHRDGLGQPRFADSVRHHPILRFAADDATNDAILDCHPAFTGYHDIQRAKPGAVVLAHLEGSEAPLIAVQEYGRGRTLAFLSDPAGGWMDGGYGGYWGPGMLAEHLGANPPEAARTIIEDASLASNEFYNRFWVNAVRWLAATSVRRQHRDLLGRSEMAIARPGQRLAVSAEVRAAGTLEELANWSVGARLDGAGPARVALQFDRQRREFVGEVAVPAELTAGGLKVVFDAVSGDKVFTDVVTLPVVRMAGEFERTAPDSRLMADIAQAGGGRVLNSAGEAMEVFAAARQTAAQARALYAQPLWDCGWFWASMIVLLTAEWWLRRRTRGMVPQAARPRREFAEAHAVFMVAALLLSMPARAADLAAPGEPIARSIAEPAGLAFAPAVPMSWLVLLGAAALIVTLASARMARRLSTGARIGTVALRLAVLALVLLVLANPVQRGETSLPAPGAWQAVLLDTSASMSLGGERPRWREGFEWAAPILNGNAAGMAARLVTFDSTVNFSPAAPTEARGPASHLGQAIERVMEQAGDTPPTQIVVVSDGVFDDAEAITAAMAKARARRTIVSTHVVGREEVLTNLAFKRFHVPRFADPNSQVTVAYEIAATGLPPTTPLAVTIRREDGSVAGRDSWTLGENTKPREIQLPVGERAGHFTAQLEVAAGEVTEADNALSFRIDLSDPKIHVLYGEGSQSLFEVGTDMMNALLLISTALRRSGDIECDVFAPQEQDAPGLPIYYVRGYNEAKETVLDLSRSLPADRAGWMHYDVVIISDIDRRSFSAAQMEWVRQLVTERGGGFAMFGGNWGFDTGNFDHTLWEKLIPVDCLEFGFGHAWRPTQPVFPAAVRRHPILRLVEDEATNNAILDSHPALNGYHDIRRAKPGAVVLAKVQDRESPLIAIQEYGRGRTMAFLSDPAGGWGDHGYQGFWGPGMLAEHLGPNPPDAARAIIEDTSLAANEFYNRFWANAVRWLAGTSVRRQHRDLLGRSEVAIARPGEKLVVSADVRAGVSPEELANWSVGARLDGAGPARVALQFDRQRREFVGEVGVPADLASGDLKVLFDAVSGNEAFTDVVTVPVVRMASEFERTAPDPRLMADIAQAGGGRVLNTADEAAGAFAAARQTTAQAHISYARPLWDRAWLWVLMVMLLTAEWGLRRRARGLAVQEANPGREFAAAQVVTMVAVLLYPSYARAADPVTNVARVCLIFGNPGDAEHRQLHAKLRAQLERTFRERFGVPADALSTFNADPAAPGAPPAARDRLLALVRDAAAKAQPDAATWLIFIGHANATRTGANFQVPGADVTETDLRAALAAAHPAGPVVILLTTSSSGRIVRSIAGPNRFIFAATRASDQDNETELPAVLATVLNAPATDANGDGIVSLLELFQACVTGVRREYTSQGLIQTEMPGLDGNGDGRATQRPSPEDAEPAARIGLKLFTTQR